MKRLSEVMSSVFFKTAVLTKKIYIMTISKKVTVFCVYSGVYISMYSDCLDLNCWYHEKSGYIAIIRLTKVLTKM